MEPHITERAAGGDINETAREEGLSPLRQLNFARLAKRLRELVQSTCRRPVLLDVGCAHGWFLEANAAHFSVSGLEPDKAVFEAASLGGMQIRNGFFPEALGDDERFNVIVFNDVLEHIPDVNSTLLSCRKHLVESGWVVVNAPSRRGALYRLARLLSRLGMPAPFNRMWQVGLPSPHVHYFDSASIMQIAQRSGFAVRHTMALRSITIRGLYPRILASGDVTPFRAFMLAAGVGVAAPVLALLPSDIEVWFLQRLDDDTSAPPLVPTTV